jgi:hypothetical protein
MFVLNPDPYSLPCYRIGPFKTNDLAINHCLADDNLIDHYLSERFKDKTYVYTENGRKAINIALTFYNLKKDDIVTILTTSGNFYISGCVTSEIEKFCKWSRKIEPSTKILFVNHEFGFPLENIGQLKEYNLPIIEDCANSFFTKDVNDTIGKTGDFVIYSFPKMFPIQIGGLLVSTKSNILPKSDQITEQEIQYIKNVLSRCIISKDEIIEKRIKNFNFLANQFKSIGLFERFSLSIGIVPGVFMFRKGNLQIDLNELKRHFYSHGIQCSVFYGEDSFFIPTHQALNEFDLEYFTEVMKSFIYKTIS